MLKNLLATHSASPAWRGTLQFYNQRRWCSTLNTLPLSQVVKIHCTRSSPDRVQQWQNKSQRHGTGSGFIISDQRILTNAHVVADYSFVTVTKHNSGVHFPARVTAVGHECDIACLEVEDRSFFDSIEKDDHFVFGEVPQLQDTVTVLGYPTGGDAISVTRGVVSRVEVTSYIHAAHYLLAIQIDAAINSGNSGGPAIKDGKVVGIAFQNMPDAENVGYIIATPIIEHFLEDIRRFGDYRGFCFIGIAYQTLPDTKTMHRFFKLPDDKTGILVTKVFDYSVSKGIIKENDIVTHIDGNAIMNDGTTNFRSNETIAMEHLITSKFDQEFINVTVWRDGQELQLKNIQMSIPNDGGNGHLVPVHMYEKQSAYYAFGGCIFTALTQPYLHTFSDEWYYHGPRDLVTEAMKGNLPCPDGMIQPQGDNEEDTDKDKDKDKESNGHGIQEIVIMSSVRPHHTNMGAGKFCNIVLEKVGDTKITSLHQLKRVIEQTFIANMNEKPLIDFHFRRNALMVLDVKQTVLAEREIMKRNRIPHRQSVDLDQYDSDPIQKLFDEINAGTYDEQQADSVGEANVYDGAEVEDGDEHEIHPHDEDEYTKVIRHECDDDVEKYNKHT